MMELPMDSQSRVIGAKARQQVHGAFNVERWEYREVTGADRGIDCEVELIINNEFTGRKIQGQIKGTSKPYKKVKTDAFSFPLDTKIIKYAINQNNPFVLFYVDVENKIVYYVSIQDLYISDPKHYDERSSNKTINVSIPCENIVSDMDLELQELAKTVYIGGPKNNLRRVKDY